MNKLPEKEPQIANAIIRCLRVWKQRSHPRELIIHSEDIDQLVEWAREMSKLWELTKEFYEDNDFPFVIVPKQIRRYP